MLVQPELELPEEPPEEEVLEEELEEPEEEPPEEEVLEEEEEELDELEEETVHLGAVLPEGAQTISAALLSSMFAKQPAALFSIHLIQGLLFGHVGINPLVQ